jgi:hypothetical protein
MFVATDICCYIRSPNVNLLIFYKILTAAMAAMSGQYKEEVRLLKLLYTNERHELWLSTNTEPLIEMNHA